MATWALIILIVYIVGFLAFAVALTVEAPKHGTTLGMQHFLVALIWPAWAIWYGAVTLRDWWRK